VSTSDEGALDPAVSAALERVEELLDAFEMDPDEGIQEMAVELLRSIDTVHRAGITRLAEYLHSAGEPIRQRALADPSVRLLFELYDLLPNTSSGFIPLDEIEVIEEKRS
jgi:hypothetical protein